MGFPSDSEDEKSVCSVGDIGEAGLILGRENTLEKEMETHSRVLA